MPDFQFDNLADFLHMDGYALYVWASYGFFAVAMAWSLIQPRLERRKVIKLLKARMLRDAGLQARQTHPEEQS